MVLKNKLTYVLLACLSAPSVSCRPQAFFSPTGPVLDPVDKASPLAFYCQIPLPPFTELGILTIRCHEGRCPDIGLYARRLGANGIIYNIAPQEDDIYKMLLIDRTWPAWQDDISSGDATILRNDYLKCEKGN